MTAVRGQRSWLSLVLTAAAYAVLIGLGYARWGSGTGLQSWVLVVTGFVLIWYTWETARLRESANRQVEVGLSQIEASIRPLVIMEFDSDQFAVRNVSGSPAFNVRVREVMIHPSNPIYIRFRTNVPSLLAGERKAIESSVSEKAPGAHDMFTAHLDPRYAALTLDVTLHFENAEGLNYTVRHTVGPGLVRIHGIQRTAD